ncbi:MAG: WD40-like beta Propeller containing protein [Acidobacteriaceae bacterium]|nr:WD40-like beta Propeller containing protein [Acidobacteriaceae bacterium]
MTQKPLTRLHQIAEWLLLAALTVVFAFHILPNAWRTLNTDFPNYLLTAQLARQGYDTSQAYDWRWLQREKDHRGIDQRIVGLAPITPFSTLFVWPLANLAPLTAKHVWLVLQLGLLIPVAFALRVLTQQPLRRIALLALACQPLHRNLLYGQFYILLLALLVAACWAYWRRLSILAGALIGIATMTKIFPAIFLLYFLRKRDGRALAAGVLTIALCSAVSVAVYGWSMHRYYLEIILPWTLRGEALPPYILSASSLSTLLHCLFVFEPQWNPHPWHNLPAVFAILAPTLQMLILAPALLLIPTGATIDDRTSAPLEWSALLCATLAISTVPASYNFTLLLLPIVVLSAALIPRNRLIALIAVFLFLAIGYPGWKTSQVDGLAAILHVPRLFFLIAFTGLCLWPIAQGRFKTPAPNNAPNHLHPQSDLIWSATFFAILVFSIVSNLRHQRGLYDDYQFRIPIHPDSLLAVQPSQGGTGVESINLYPEGYRLTEDGAVSEPIESGSDALSFASSSNTRWIEQVNTTSRLVAPNYLTIDNARSPILAADGTLIAYIRDELGRGRLYAHEVLVSSESMNVLEATALSDGSFLAAASIRSEPEQIFEIKPNQASQPANLGRARYPALSPDGRWLAYSRFEQGSWNLWLENRSTHAIHSLTSGACNHVEPAWEQDSKTLLYASDCGRALGFTAICRRRVIP